MGRSWFQCKPSRVNPIASRFKRFDPLKTLFAGTAASEQLDYIDAQVDPVAQRFYRAYRWQALKQ